MPPRARRQARSPSLEWERSGYVQIAVAQYRRARMCSNRAAPTWRYISPMPPDGIESSPRRNRGVGKLNPQRQKQRPLARFVSTALAPDGTSGFRNASGLFVFPRVFLQVLVAGFFDSFRLSTFAQRSPPIVKSTGWSTIFAGETAAGQYLLCRSGADECQVRGGRAN